MNENEDEVRAGDREEDDWLGKERKGKSSPLYFLICPFWMFFFSFLSLVLSQMEHISASIERLQGRNPQMW